MYLKLKQNMLQELLNESFQIIFYILKWPLQYLAASLLFWERGTFTWNELKKEIVVILLIEGYLNRIFCEIEKQKSTIRFF